MKQLKPEASIIHYYLCITVYCVIIATVVTPMWAYKLFPVDCIIVVLYTAGSLVLIHCRVKDVWAWH